LTRLAHTQALVSILADIDDLINELESANEDFYCSQCLDTILALQDMKQSIENEL